MSIVSAMRFGMRTMTNYDGLDPTMAYPFLIVCDSMPTTEE